MSMYSTLFGEEIKATKCFLAAVVVAAANYRGGYSYCGVVLEDGAIAKGGFNLTIRETKAVLAIMAIWAGSGHLAKLCTDQRDDDLVLVTLRSLWQFEREAAIMAAVGRWILAVGELKERRRGGVRLIFG